MDQRSNIRNTAPWESTRLMARPKSRQLYGQALRLEPAGVGGSDQRSPRGGFLPHPIFMATGEGAYIWDVDGNRYTDYLAAWGPLILGHRPNRVLEAAHRALDEMGPMLGFNHELEVAAAEAAIAAVPCWERMRFSNTGSEAVMLALRAARAYTGREKVLRFEGHFHGWTDLVNFSVKPDLAVAGSDDEPAPVPGSAGMVRPHSLVVRQWNDPASLERTFSDQGDDLAAVICEPLLAGCTVIPPRPGYLELLRKLCSRHGVVLIFDEVKTGFRVALGGAQELYGILPDLSVAAKAMGAGFPVAAVGGRQELFEPFERGEANQGSTYQANPVALAACIATLAELREPRFFRRISELGDLLAEGLTAQAHEAGLTAYCRGVGPILQLVFADHQVGNCRDFLRSADQAAYRAFWRLMAEEGQMFTPQPTGCWFVSSAHTEGDIEKTLEVAGRQMWKVPAAAAGAKER